MKNQENLTPGQQAIVDSLVAEFKRINDVANPYVMETDISLTFTELVKCDQTDYYDIKCYDGYAIANNGFISAYLTYPKLSEMSESEKIDCLNYRYYKVERENVEDISFGDVMMRKSKLDSFKIL